MTDGGVWAWGPVWAGEGDGVYVRSIELEPTPTPEEKPRRAQGPDWFCVLPFRRRELLAILGSLGAPVTADLGHLSVVFVWLQQVLGLGQEALAPPRETASQPGSGLQRTGDRGETALPRMSPPPSSPRSPALTPSLRLCLPRNAVSPQKVRT